MTESSESDSLAACAENSIIVIPGLCPNCGEDVEIEWRICEACSHRLG